MSGWMRDSGLLENHYLLMEGYDMKTVEDKCAFTLSLSFNQLFRALVCGQVFFALKALELLSYLYSTDSKKVRKLTKFISLNSKSLYRKKI